MKKRILFFVGILTCIFACLVFSSCLIEGRTVAVTFIYNDDTGTVKTQNIPKGDRYFDWVPESEYTFTGWYTESGKKFDFSTSITNDIVLIANWTGAPTPQKNIEIASSVVFEENSDGTYNNKESIELSTPNTPDGNSEVQTTVKIPEGALVSSSNSADVEIEVTTYSVSASANNSEFTVEESEEGKKYAVAGIDCTVKVNGNIVSEFIDSEGSKVPVTVETYILKGLTDPQVKYTGTAEVPTDVTYDSNSGLITFKTTHFSTFYVVVDADAYIVETSYAYASLGSAVADSKDNQTIKLLRDITVEEDITVSKDITVDFNKKEVAVAENIKITLSCGTYTLDPTTLEGFVLADGYDSVAQGTDPETWKVQAHVAPKPVGNVFTANTTQDLEDVINELNTNTAYTTGDYTIKLGAGTIGGTWDAEKNGYIANVYVIKQFPEWNGYYGNGATNNNTVKPNTNCTRITIVGSETEEKTVFKGAIVVVGWGYSNGGDYEITSTQVRTEIKNLNFDYTDVVGVDETSVNSAFGNSTDGYLPIIGCGASTNVMITNCSFKKINRIRLGLAQSSDSNDTDNLFDDSGKVTVVKGYSFSPVVENCTFTDCDTCFDGYFSGSKRASFSKITATGCDAFINAQNGNINTINVTDSNITCSNYLIRTYNQSVKWTFDNCTINITNCDTTDNKYGVVTFREGTITPHTITFDNCTFTGSKEILAFSGNVNNTVIMKGTSPKASEMVKTQKDGADCTIKNYTE